VRCFLLLIALALAACDSRQNLAPPDLDLNRMREQPRYDVWEASPFFPSGGVMQAPPEDTVPRHASTVPEAVREGLEGGEPVALLPLPITEQLLAEGRRRYEITCAPCHGVDGSARTVVADNMPLVKPPSFHSETLRALPPGRVFQVITNGYGMMPRYSWHLDVEQRWAVVAWVRVLQRSRFTRLAELPADLRRRALEELPP
jgi:mono/diheme cytochrome c family protein